MAFLADAEDLQRRSMQGYRFYAGAPNVANLVLND
jgi:hypothetical protein